MIEKNEKHRTGTTKMKIKKTRCNGVGPFEFYFKEKESQGMHSLAYVKNESPSMRSFAKANSQNQSRRKLLSYEAYLRRRRRRSYGNSTTTSCRYILQGIVIGLNIQWVETMWKCTSEINASVKFLINKDNI